MEPKNSPKNTNEHLANERTLLAWIRTAIAIITFGFVIVKFSLFLRQMAIVTGNEAAIPKTGFSGPVGTLLVVLGALGLIFGGLRYRAAEQQLNRGAYRHRSGGLYVFIGLMLAISLVLVIYLVETAL
jgi:putative membrane protein